MFVSYRKQFGSTSLYSTRTFCDWLTQVIFCFCLASRALKLHIVRIHFVNTEVAIFLIICNRFICAPVAVTGWSIPQPPSTTVGCLPYILRCVVALHGLTSTTTTIVAASMSHIHNQTILFWVVVFVLTHSVIHDLPVVFIAWRPNLVSIWAGMYVRALADLVAIVDPYHLPRGIPWCRETNRSAAGWTARSAGICISMQIYVHLGVPSAMWITRPNGTPKVCIYILQSVGTGNPWK